MYVVGWLCFSTLEKWPSVGDVLCIPAMHTPFSSPQDQGPAGPRVVSGLHLQTWSAGCGTVVFLLLVSGPWWVELGLGPLVGKAMSRGMSRGSCGLRKSLGSLSTDGWGCVPTQFVVWPEAFQHWSLQAVGWGQSWCQNVSLQESSHR